MSDSDKVELKASPGSDPRKLGSSIAHNMAENRQVFVRCIGAGSVNQAQKAIAIASGWTAPRGIQLASIPAFINIEGREGTISGMSFKVISVNN